MSKRKKRRNGDSWMDRHPWLTFFLVGSAITGVVTIVRGRDNPTLGQ